MNFFALVGLTLKELRHSKLIILPLTVTIALILVAANIENPSVYGDKLLVGAWSGLAFVGALVGILAASSLISSEIERGTMLLLASRPVSRITIVAAKAAGIVIYLLLCGLVWALALAFGMGANTDAGIGAAFLGAMIAVAPMLLAAMVALTASALFPTRGAIGASLALWVTAVVVATIPLDAVKAANRGRVEITQDILGWVIPQARLGDLSQVAIGNSVSPAAYWALLIVGAWLSVAAIIFKLRGSIAR